MNQDPYKLGYRQAILDVLDFLNSKLDDHPEEVTIGELMKSISRFMDLMR